MYMNEPTKILNKRKFTDFFKFKFICTVNFIANHFFIKKGQCPFLRHCSATLTSKKVSSLTHWPIIVLSRDPAAYFPFKLN